MRLVWVLAIACLMAATTVRPLHLERRDPHAVQLDVDAGMFARLARREAPHLPELRLGAFVLAQPPAVTTPAMLALATDWRLVSSSATSAADTGRARGPPIA